MLVYQKVYHIEPWFSVPAGYEFHESSSLINDVTILIKHGFWNNPPHIWVGPFVHYPTINFRKIKGGFLVFLKTRRQLQQDQPLNVGNKQEKTSQNHSRLPGEYLLKFSRFFLFGFGMLLGTPHHDTSSCGWCLETYRDIYRYFFFSKESFAPEDFAIWTKRKGSSFNNHSSETFAVKLRGCTFLLISLVWKDLEWLQASGNLEVFFPCQTIWQVLPSRWNGSGYCCKITDTSFVCVSLFYFEKGMPDQHIG